MKLRAFTGQSGPLAFVTLDYVSDDGTMSMPNMLSVIIPCRDRDHAYAVATAYNGEEA